MSDILAAFYSRPTEESGREHREMWTLAQDKSSVMGPFTGWSCAPDYPECWWIPAFGFSCSLGNTCWETEAAAVDALRVRLRLEINRLTAILGDLK